MKTEEKIRALAELDGWKFDHVDFAGRYRYAKLGSLDIVFEDLPSYLTSYDAIIPLIQKHHPLVMPPLPFTATPAQLCEALLRATGKWKE